MLGKVLGQQTNETDKDFLHALGRLAMYDGSQSASSTLAEMLSSKA